MSGLKKVFIIFTVAIVLATASNIFLGGANATDDPATDAVNETVENSNTNTNSDTNADTTANTSTENTTDGTTNDNNANADTNAGTNVDTNTSSDNNSADTNTSTNTSTKNEVDWSQLRNTLPKTGSNYPLKNVLLAIIFVAMAVLGFVFMYNKKVGMTDETKR